MSTTTAADGSYSLKLAQGHYQVKVEHPEIETDTFEVDIIAGQTTDGSRVVKRRGTLAGTIKDEEGKPVANATITVTKVS